MRRLICFIAFYFFLLTTFAQSTIVKGHVYDSVAQQSLSYATLNLLHTDSTLVTFSRADADGFFRLSKIAKGPYLISASYVGYVPVWKRIIVSDSINDIGILYMQDLKHVDSITVQAKRPPVVINNDTLEFNTENFKTLPNAVVEDMLKRMPGITVDNDGAIKVNGETVKRVLVNGKEFFTGDIKAATKNLPAEAVDKVQVYNKQSDQSQFTGIDDGNSEKTINLKLKKDKDHAMFGKVTAGAGNDGRFDAQANVNKLKGDEQLSLLGMSNNTNRQGFDIMDMLNFTGELAKGMRNGGGIVIKNDNGNDDNGGLPVTGLGQKQQGIATTTAGGINYNNFWKNNTDWNSSYMGSDIHLVTDKDVQTQNFLPGNTFINHQSGNAVTGNTQHRFNIALDQKFDSSTSLKITPSVTFQHTNKTNNTTYDEFNSNNVKLNEGFNKTATSADAFNFTNNILFRKRLNKPGRTISLNANLNYNHSRLNGNIISDNKLFNENGTVDDSSLNQQYNRDAITKNIGATIIYTEPMGKRSLLEFSGYFNTSTSTSNKRTYDYNHGSDKYDAYNRLLSNDFKSSYSYSGGGINYRINPKKLNVTVGSQLQVANLEAINNTFHQTVQKSFTDLLPRAIVQYNISRLKNVRFEYSTSTTQPSTVQLQPVADVSDPLHIVIGNANLQREYQHQLSMHMLAGNPILGKSLFGFINFSATNNALVNVDSIFQNGTSRRTYTNTNGVYSLFGNLEYGFPIKKLKSRIDVGMFSRLGRNASFVNGERNNIKSFTLGPNIGYHFDKDDIISLDVSANVTINSTTYSLQQFISNTYLQQSYGVNLTNYLPAHFYLLNDFNYIIYTGRTNGFNTNVPLWNISLGKTFLKNNRGELKLSVQDILNENTGISRSSNQGFITDERYNVLQRYFLISFTYTLNKAGLKSRGPKAVIKTFNN